MEAIPNEDKVESIKSFESTIGKLEKALAQMTQKGANTTLVEKRLKACCIGLAMLENAWHQKPHPYTAEELSEARHVLMGLLPSIESVYEKSKTGSPQKTLLERRVKALKLAIDELFKR